MASKSLRQRVRPILFQFHLWTGLVIGLYFAILGITGSFLVFRNDVEESLFPEIVAVKPAPNAVPLTASGMYAALRKARPNLSEAELASLELPRYAGGAFGAFVKEPDGLALITMNPYSGDVISKYSYETHWVGWIGELHMTLLMEAKGMLLNSVGGIIVSLLLISGIWLWWPAAVNQWRARLTVKRGASLKRLLNDLHNVFGVYGLGFLTVLTLTGAAFGLWTQIEDAAYRATGAAKDKPVSSVTVPQNASRLPVEQLVKIAQDTVPDSRLSHISYPQKPEQPFSVRKVTDQGQFLYVQMSIDPYTGKVLWLQDSRNQPPAGQFMRWIQMLHFGWWGHWWSQIPYALLGLLPAGLWITGVGRYILRIKAKRAPKPTKTPVTA